MIQLKRKGKGKLLYFSNAILSAYPPQSPFAPLFQNKLSLVFNPPNPMSREAASPRLFTMQLTAT
jgi:hypothetical protein